MKRRIDSFFLAFVGNIHRIVNSATRKAAIIMVNDFVEINSIMFFSRTHIYKRLTMMKKSSHH